MKPKWILEDGLVFVRMLVPLVTEAGCSIALGGSVLKRGSSDKDIDIILHPLVSNRGSFEWKDKAKKALETGGLKLMHSVEVVHAKWRKQGSIDEKHVEVWVYEGRRVDVFFME